MNIANYAIQKKNSLWVIIILLLIGGFISYKNLGRFEDPEFIIRQAVIVTPYSGASAVEVADEVTEVIETAVQSLQELKEVKSISKQGSSEVTVEIKLEFSKTKAELDQVWDKLRRKVSDAQRNLPTGAGPSFVNDDFADVYALFYAITGPGYTDKQLNDYVKFLQKELALVKGVAKTATLGTKTEQIFIELSSERLQQYGVSLEQIYQTLQHQTLVTVAGDIELDGMRLPVIPNNTLKTMDDLKNLKIGINSTNTVLQLNQIANVYQDYKEPFSVLMSYNGEHAIGLGISNVSGGNVVEMGDAVKQRLAELESQRPIGMELNEISIQSDSVRASVANFIDNLIAAVVIVFVVLLIFMGVRSGIIIGFVLLLTVAGTLIIMLIDDIAMQRISLGALIIALGMLVDNAIVVTDGVLVRLQQGQDKLSAIKEVVNSTIWPLLGGTVVGILAFSAIGLSPSDMGEYAGSLFWVICYSMFLSWLFAITITPLLCYQFLTVDKNAKAAKESRILTFYHKILLLVLRNRLITGAVLLTLLLIAIANMGRIPPGFMPESQRAQFVVDAFLPQGTDINKTADMMVSMSQLVKQKEHVTNVTSFIGSGGLRFMLSYAPEPRNSAYGQLLIDVDDYKNIDVLLDDLQTELSVNFPDASIKVWKFMLGRGGGKKIEAGFSGPDPKVLRALAEEAKALMNADNSLIAVQDDWRQQVPVIKPYYIAEVMQQQGLSAKDLNQAIAQSLTGRQIAMFRQNDDLIPMVVRAPETERQHKRVIENVNVYSAQSQAFIPISQFVSSVGLEWEDSLIRKINRIPTILVQADPAPGVLSNDAFLSIKDKMEQIILPSGYELKWYGEYKASNDANEGIAVSAPYGFAAMILAVIFMFNAFKQPIVIWMTVPLAIVGVVIGLVIYQTPFEFMAILGFLSLIGMMVKNAIVLVDQADNDIRDGTTPFDAVVGASLSRAKPVVLGAATTIMGVAPLLLDPFFKSMAVTIMFGLLFATVLTLIVIPLLYAVLFRIQK
ncbi:MAG: efflux RND transporter permease subunit [Shewanella oncorhynchi]